MVEILVKGCNEECPFYHVEGKWSKRCFLDRKIRLGAEAPLTVPHECPLFTDGRAVRLSSSVMERRPQMKTDRQKVAGLMSELGVKVDTARPKTNDIIVDARIGNVWFDFDENGKFKSITTGE